MPIITVRLGFSVHQPQRGYTGETGMTKTLGTPALDLPITLKDG